MKIKSGLQPDGGWLLDDTLAFDPQYSEVCSYCKHETGYRICKAFEYIPNDIWLGKNKHVTAYPGDNGIMFEKRE